MDSVRFSTRELTKRHQLEAWQEWYVGINEIAIDAPDHGFAGDTEVWTLDGLAFVRVSTPSLRATRTRQMIRRDPTDHWVVTIGKRTAADLILEDDQLSIPAGVPYVWSLSSFSDSQMSSDTRLHLCIARDKFSTFAPALDATRGRVVSTPLGDLLAGYILLLERKLPALSEEDRHSLPQAIAAMVAACVAPSAERLAVAHGQVTASLKDKARRFILRNLNSPHLGPEELCRELGVSRSKLYRLLEADGGVARYVQHLRLLEGFAQLSDPSNRKPIVKIADESGMQDHSQFSRAFRREFGISPTDAREAAQAGLVPSIIHAHPVAARSIGGLLSSL
ncbi:helix-turn-helix domain-containing protein [Mesorhizobium sp. VK25A]|uniref:Helix-turn-helix domain-containing protein n=1 Tax=Mesorhizobium vachelliae TaxID=3072309 RepID=A0ABU5A631_9HYPH|nr:MULTISPECIES: helix-turn-helix domain-containing protein [unclassified Mesorhizobium]MDX8533161.1 helix-turn-helix domain-containing protein [Mesorhizobium sp. VK25D]MDX8545080.1 helix-turn-helix domain-containing protein [Mesorhizobium sp. VK25A]